MTAVWMDKDEIKENSIGEFEFEDAPDFIILSEGEAHIAWVEEDKREMFMNIPRKRRENNVLVKTEDEVIKLKTYLRELNS